MTEFLSDDWLDLLWTRLDALAPGAEGSDGRLSFHAGSRCFGLVVRDGRVSEWSADALADADLEVCWSAEASWAVLGGHANGTSAAAVSVLHETRTGYCGPPPPLDIARRPALAGLPAVPRADLTIQFEIAAAPFGNVETYMAFVDGRLEQAGPGRASLPDLGIGIPFDALRRLRSGEIEPLEALRAGQLALRGRAGLYERLLLISGLLESPAFLAALREGAHATRAWGSLAALTGATEARAVLNELGAGTPRPLDAS